MTDQPLRAAILPVTPLQQNCSLVWCTKTMRGAFVDPGGDLGAGTVGEGHEDGVEVAGLGVPDHIANHESATSTPGLPLGAAPRTNAATSSRSPTRSNFF